jgi:hypothetical protein
MQRFDDAAGRDFGRFGIDALVMVAVTGIEPVT